MELNGVPVNTARIERVNGKAVEATIEECCICGEKHHHGEGKYRYPTHRGSHCSEPTEMGYYVVDKEYAPALERLLEKVEDNGK